MTEHILTIDLGTSGPKVASFTVDGTFVDGDSAPVELLLSDDGRAEQRPADWWRAIADASQRVIGRGAVPVDSIIAVSVTSQWSGTVAIDRAGRPLRNAIIWMDSRGASAVRERVGGAVRVQGYDDFGLRYYLLDVSVQ